jgi:hypothetical protein
MTSARDREDESGPAGSEEQVTGLYTETLARLYMQQGYGAKALAIYRYLIGLQPDNAKLRAKATALERQLAASEPGEVEEVAGDRGEGSGSRRHARTGQARVLARLEGWLVQLRQQRQVSQARQE